MLLAGWRDSKKLYPSWEAAQAACDQYDSAELSRFRQARSRAYVPSPKLARATLLPLSVQNMGLEDGVITDFGGACGELGRSLQCIFPQVTYTVAETPGIVAGAGLLADSIRFSQTTPESCDIFYSGGTLQYVDDPRATMAQAFASARHAVIFSRNSFSEMQLFRIHAADYSRMATNPYRPGIATIR